ncbi:hypothetical protein CEXT_188861 [Caerostris extrusa]|uniref:Uncharacterized protein n=1 Tax=Caerostris extrusa TaxID=172846 RepID=A0AAV4NMX0_CAEEX|nr:hypothetical protein CEXT_188861 [Caerostris extrusa]
MILNTEAYRCYANTKVPEKDGSEVCSAPNFEISYVEQKIGQCSVVPPRKTSKDLQRELLAACANVDSSTVQGGLIEARRWYPKNVPQALLYKVGFEDYLKTKEPILPPHESPAILMLGDAGGGKDSHHEFRDSSCSAGESRLSLKRSPFRDDFLVGREGVACGDVQLTALRCVGGGS